MTTSELNSLFQRHFDAEPDVLAVAPGRINLIGEHTDYNEGFVFPAAIDLQLYVAARRVPGPSRLISNEVGEAKPFDLQTVMPGYVEDWAKFAAGMAWVMRDRCELPNIEAVVHSDVPIGSGVSSSAALELAFGVVFNHLAGLGIENKELALMGQRAENDFVGVKVGIMDQMASAIGREGHAMFLDTRSLDIQYAPIPDDLAIAVLDTKTPRSLTDSAYNERRSQCEQACEALGVKALRDANVPDLEQQRPEMDDLTYRRAKHVISENDRTIRMVEALASSDLTEIGMLMRASHESLRDDYEVSSRELDMMTEAAWGSPGCVGARMTGAGFGGACVALVQKEKIAEFTASVNTGYQQASGLNGEVTICSAVDGARILKHL